MCIFMITVLRKLPGDFKELTGIRQKTVTHLEMRHGDRGHALLLQRERISMLVELMMTAMHKLAAAEQ